MQVFTKTELLGAFKEIDQWISKAQELGLFHSPAFGLSSKGMRRPDTKFFLKEAAKVNIFIRNTTYSIHFSVERLTMFKNKITKGLFNGGRTLQRGKRGAEVSSKTTVEQTLKEAILLANEE